MYVTKGTNGFYIKVTSEYHGEKTEGYIQASFKRGSEPMSEDLNDYNSYEGKLFFEHKGRRREVFPGCYKKKDGCIGYKLIFMDEEVTEEDVGEGEALNFQQDDLPFY